MPRIRTFAPLLAIAAGFAMYSGHASAATANTVPTPDPSIPLYQWDEVTLPADSGADCGNGTPYRFYINRAVSNNLLFSLEGGGACWDYGSCTDAPGVAHGASNPDGIPQNYMNGTLLESLVSTFESPLMTRINLATFLLEPRIETQDWTQVFMPFCTGVIHAGTAVRAYASPDGDTIRIQHFNGLRNTRAVTKWLVEHGLGQPDRLLVYGLSAGGYGALTNYAQIRQTLQPRGASGMLDDAGTVFFTPMDADPSTHPSVYAYNRIAKEWNLAAPDGFYATMHKLTTNFDSNNLGSLYQALSNQYPHDRFGLSTFQQDEVISGFHYDAFDPAAMATTDPAARSQLDLQLFDMELPGIKKTTAALPNFGYYMPWARGGFINNHTVTAVTFSGTAIHENGINADVGDFVNDLLSQQDPAITPVTKDFRTQQWSDPLTVADALGVLEALFTAL